MMGWDLFGGTWVCVVRLLLGIWRGFLSHVLVRAELGSIGAI